MHNDSIAIHWFRRDLRLEDNAALAAASKSGMHVQGLFIFDPAILEELRPDDARVGFIHERLQVIDKRLRESGSSLLVLYGDPAAVLRKFCSEHRVADVYANEDYEPYALQRDAAAEATLKQIGCALHLYQDHLILRPGSVLKSDGTAYTVFTPFKRSWLATPKEVAPIAASPVRWNPSSFELPTLESLGFRTSRIRVLDLAGEHVLNYGDRRNQLSRHGSLMGPHLRFGTISVRQAFELAAKDETFLAQLVWREFFVHILFFFPQVVGQSFRPQYDRIQWRNDPDELARWTEGSTGYPLVDAGMRELLSTGYMHNRARMVVASFLSKHLLVDWRLGEAHFAQHLLDYELASNNGNWQWAAGTGCDAAPYFRVFNPEVQQQRFDPEGRYVKRWVPEWGTSSYPAPMVEHTFARERAISRYRAALSGY